MRFTGNGITNCYPDQVDNFVSITVLRMPRFPMLKTLDTLSFEAELDLTATQASVGRLQLVAEAANLV